MSAKKFLFNFIISSSSLVLLVSAFFYFTDPLYLYRNTEVPQPQYNGTARYQIAGLVRNQQYNTLFTATSMGRNFYESYADGKLKTKSFNASLPASTAREQSFVAELALREKKQELHQIIWEINYYSFESTDPKWVMEGPSDFPTYMYDTSKINDIRYLFNSYTLEVLLKNLKGNRNGEESRRDLESLYKFANIAPPESLERVNTSLKRITPITELPEEKTSETMLESFKYNVIRLAEQYPNTKFTLFFAPYTVYNHVSFYKTHPDYLSERLEFKKAVFELISNYKNIELYDFQDEEQITFNIANYYGDGIHYYHEINNWIIDYIAENPPIQTFNQYDQKLKRFEEQVVTFRLEDLVEDNSFRAVKTN